MRRALTIAAFVGIFTLALGCAKEPDKSKETYTQKAEGEIQEWTAKLKSLQERSQKSGAKTRQELDQEMKVADEKLAVAQKKLEDLKASSEGTWTNFRKGLEEAMREVKHALQKVQALFNKSETPATKASAGPPKK